MKPYLVSPLTKQLIVRFSNREVRLPKEIQSKIDAYWDEILASGKSYKRGEVFTVTRKEATEKAINILVEKTDYAHYLYCQNIDTLGEYGVHIIHTASLVDTSDGKTLIGKMGEQTARSGIHQLCGGGIDHADLKEGIFDFEHNIKKELQEELGIDVADTDRVRDFELAYFKEGGPTDKMTVIYRVSLNETADQFLKAYDVFSRNLLANGETPEFGDIVVIEKDEVARNAFLNTQGIRLDEYVRPLFEYMNGEMTVTKRGEQEK